MEQAVGQLRPSDPLAADMVADALDEARRLALGAAMRTAGSQLEENRIGQVARRTSRSSPDLQEVLDILANRRQQELARLVKKLREAERELASSGGAGGTAKADARRRQPAPEQKAQLDELGPGRRLSAGDRAAGPPVGTPAGGARRAKRCAGGRADGQGRPGRGGRWRRGDAGAGAAEKTLEEARPAIGRPAAPGPGGTRHGANGPLGRRREALAEQQQTVLGGDAAARRARASGGRVPAGRPRACSTWPAPAIAPGGDRPAGRALAGAGAFHLALSAAASEMGRPRHCWIDRRTGPPTQAGRAEARRPDSSWC